MNRLTLAVAGSRKTQSIVDECRSLEAGAGALVLTYTRSNQLELERRLREDGGPTPEVEVMGWLSFLINHWVKPYLPLLYPDRRVRGFDFDGDPGRLAKGERRYFDREGRVYRRHLPKLSVDVNTSSSGALLDRLARIYRKIYIDEVQDLCGYDLEILNLLMQSKIDLIMVGDVRQALLATNPRERKNAQYMYSGILQWFRQKESAGCLQIDYRSESWRCNQLVCDFSDTIFGPEWEFPETASKNMEVTDHDGLFGVMLDDVGSYIAAYSPLCLRYSKSCGKELPPGFVNFGDAKGMTAEHVLIHCTDSIQKFIHNGQLLQGKSACGLYVAATRARRSVGLILPPSKLGSIPLWQPGLELT